MREHRLRPGGARDLDLGRRANRAHDPVAQAHRPTRDKLPDPAGRSVDQHPVPWPQDRDPVQQQMGGEATRHCRAGLAEAEPVRQANESRDRQHARFSIAAEAAPAANVRVSAPPALAAYVIAPRLPAFQSAHPNVAIVLSATPGAAALDHGEADVAVRMGRPTEAGLVAKQIGRAHFALYGAPQSARTPREDWRYIGFDAALDHVTSQRWLKTLAENRELVFRANDLFSQAQAARAGLGVTVLPRFVGDGDSQLVELPVDPPPPTQDFWLLVYPDARRAPATRAVAAFLAETVGRACPMAENSRAAGGIARAVRPFRSLPARSCPWRGRSRSAHARASDWRR